MEKKAKIIHKVHMQATPGGIEVLIPTIIQGLDNLKFKVFVVRPLQNANVYEKHNFDITYGSFNNLKAIKKLIFYIIKYRNDTFHAYNIGPYFLFLFRLFAAEKIIYSIHGTKYWRNQKTKFLNKLMWKLAISKKMNFIANSEYSKHIFKDKIAANVPIKVIYNPIHKQKIKPPATLPLEESKKTINVIYTGRLSKNKNILTCIDIVVSANKKHNTQYYFDIYGAGPMRDEIQRAIDLSNASEYVRLKGFTNNIALAYKKADVLLFLSQYESFGNVVVESILNGTPVIASGIPSMKEIFMNYPEFIVELDEQLKENVINKLENISKLKEKIPEIREDFLNRFSVEKHLSQLSELYLS